MNGDNPPAVRRAARPLPCPADASVSSRLEVPAPARTGAPRWRRRRSPHVPGRTRPPRTDMSPHPSPRRNRCTSPVPVPSRCAAARRTGPRPPDAVPPCSPHCRFTLLHNAAELAWARRGWPRRHSGLVLSSRRTRCGAAHDRSLPLHAPPPRAMPSPLPPGPTLPYFVRDVSQRTGHDATSCQAAGPRLSRRTPALRRALTPDLIPFRHTAAPPHQARASRRRTALPYRAVRAAPLSPPWYPPSAAPCPGPSTPPRSVAPPPGAGRRTAPRRRLAPTDLTPRCRAPSLAAVRAAPPSPGTG